MSTAATTPDALGAPTASPKKAVLIVSWVLSALPAGLAIFSGIGKFNPPPERLQMMTEHLGLQPSLLIPLAVMEIAIAVLYLVPRTAVLGAVLFTGFWGGAILAHLRVGDAFVMHIVLGLLVWGGLYLREPRLRTLLPIRR